MKAQITGIVTGVLIREKKQNGVVQTDDSGEVIFERKVSILDLEEENSQAPYKIIFTPEQQEKVKSFLKKNVIAVLTVHRFEIYTYYRLVSITPA